MEQTERTVENIMTARLNSNLRKKLASLQADVQIKVARGQGYFLDKK